MWRYIHRYPNTVIIANFASKFFVSVVCGTSCPLRQTQEASEDRTLLKHAISLSQDYCCSKCGEAIEIWSSIDGRCGFSAVLLFPITTAREALSKQSWIKFSLPNDKNFQTKSSAMTAAWHNIMNVKQAWVNFIVCLDPSLACLACPESPCSLLIFKISIKKCLNADFHSFSFFGFVFPVLHTSCIQVAFPCHTQSKQGESDKSPMMTPLPSFIHKIFIWAVVHLKHGHRSITRPIFFHWETCGFMVRS